MPSREDFDPACNLLVKAHRPHAHALHTRLEAGLRVHPLGDSLGYALRLLRGENAAMHARAGQILEAVAAQQVVTPDDTNYGVWPWLTEEPVGSQTITDTNTPCFFGVLYAIALKHHGDRLASSTRQIAMQALERAATGIVRRPIRAEYTNIALLGAATVAPAGELLGRADLLAHARLRMEETAASVAYHQGFAEYNSPVYTPVAIEALEKILYVTTDAGICAAARALLDVGWQVVAEHYHVATRQWAGPFSRTYSDLTDSHFIRGRCPVSNALKDAPPWALAVPTEWADRFRIPAAEASTIRRLFINRAPPQIAVYGTTWMDSEACLGSATLDNTTYQRRPLIGYWVVAGSDRPAILRVRCLRDGHDFASCVLRCAQNGPRILAAVSFAGNMGDVQHIADRPAAPVFPTSRLVVRVQVVSAGAKAGVLDDGRCILTAGARRITIQSLPAAPFGQTVRWQADFDPDGAYAEGVLYEAADPVPLDMRTAATALGFSLELSRLDEEACTPAPFRTTEGFAWPATGLTLRAPGFALYPE
jgi:hypothetical protein